MGIVSLFGVFCCLQNWIMSCNKSVLSRLLCRLVGFMLSSAVFLCFSFARRKPSQRTNFHRSHPNSFHLLAAFSLTSGEMPMLWFNFSSCLNFFKPVHFFQTSSIFSNQFIIFLKPLILYIFGILPIITYIYIYIYI